MKKHGAVLDMRTDRLIFWPRHYKQDVALKPRAAEPPAEPHAEKPGAQHTKKSNKGSKAGEPCAKEPHASRPTTILKRPTNELLPYLLPGTRGVSKVTSTSERKNTPQKNEPITIPQKPKPNAKNEARLKDKPKVEDKKPSVESANETSKPLDLAFIGGALFIHLVKSKKQRAKIFAISMRDIEYQLNKGTKPSTNLKTVVPAEYHDFLDVFSKDISDTLRPYCNQPNTSL